MNSLVIAEVLSESTEAYDRSGKFAACRTISSFQEYVLIDQYSMHTVPFEISLTNLYNKVDFEVKPETLAKTE